MERPSNVPDNAVFIEDWNEWALGSTVEGRKQGPWRCWRPEGTLVEETVWVDDVLDGRKLRYHDDGSVASEERFDLGRPLGAVHHRSDAETQERTFESLPDAIWHMTIEMTPDNWACKQTFQAKDGSALDQYGQPVPEKPAGLPHEAFFNSGEGFWIAQRWRGPHKKGLIRFWTPEGQLFRLEVHDPERGDGHAVAVLDARDPGMCSHHVLIEAAKLGDEETVQALLDLGFGGDEAVRRHAAHEGLAELVCRLGSGTPAVADPRPAPDPDRCEGVAEEAVWIPGLERYVLGDIDGDGRAIGTWKRWWAPYGYTFCTPEEASFEGGRLVQLRALRGQLPEKDTLFAEDGTKRIVRKYDDEGRLQTEKEVLEAGEVARSFHASGGRRSERIVDADDTLITETWWDATGRARLEVRPTDDGEYARALDADGVTVAEGQMAAGRRGSPVGTWTVDGVHVEMSVLDVPRNEALADAARAVARWHLAPWPPCLDGVQDVDWSGLETWYGTPDEFAFYLKGLTVDPECFDLALGELWDPILHQGTVSEATGPAFPFLCRVVASWPADHPRILPLVKFLARIATRDGQLGAALQLRRLHEASLASDDHDARRELFGENGNEPCYSDVYAALEDHLVVWDHLMTAEDQALREWAAVLLSVSRGSGEQARARIAADAAEVVQAELLLGLCLEGPSEATAKTLGTALLAGPLLRTAAALTWLRLGLDEQGEAVAALLEVLGGQPVPGFGQLLFGSGDPTSDAVQTLAMLPGEQAATHLPRFVAALDEVGPTESIGVARALLDIVFPTAAFEEGQELDDLQSMAILGIADSKTAWTFNVNLHEVLRYNGLPCDRDALRALARGEEPPPPSTGPQRLSAFST